MKDYMKARQKKARKGTTHRPFQTECFLTSNICQKITIETEQYTKYTRLRKSTNPYLQKDHVRLNWKDILLVVKVLPQLTPRCLVLQKNLYSLAIFVFLETQEMNLRGNLQEIKCDIVHTFMRTFFVLRKSSFPLLTLQFFSKHFYTRPQ